MKGIEGPLLKNQSTTELTTKEYQKCCKR